MVVNLIAVAFKKMNDLGQCLYRFLAGIAACIMQQQHRSGIFLPYHAGNNTIGRYARLPVPGVDRFANGDIALLAAFGYRYNFRQCLRLGIRIKRRPE